MKTTLCSLFNKTVLVGFIVVAGGVAPLSVSAQTTTTTTPGQTTPAPGHKNGAFKRKVMASNANEAAPLSQAYALLSQADHDYKGHRERAMHHIEAAAKFLGLNLRGQGKGAEQQNASDSQVTTARSLLQNALSGLTGRARYQVNEAINQLNIALSVK